MSGSATRHDAVEAVTSYEIPDKDFAEPLGLAFTIDEFFWDAVMGAVIITIVSWLLSVVLPDGDD